MNEDTNQKSSGISMSKFAIAGLVVIAVVLISQLMTPSLLNSGAPAPPWKLPLSGEGHETLTLEEMKGKVVLISFWSTTCPPCIEELKNLNAMWPAFEKKGVRFVGISAGGEARDVVASFNKNKRLSFPLAVGNGAVADAYLVRVLPTLYILDRNGNVFAAHTGYQSREALTRELNRALSDQPN